MDKTIAFILIGFFIVCACLSTWCAVSFPKINKYGRLISWIHASVIWLCVVAMVIITIIY